MADLPKHPKPDQAAADHVTDFDPPPAGGPEWLAIWTAHPAAPPIWITLPTLAVAGRIPKYDLACASRFWANPA